MDRAALDLDALRTGLGQRWPRIGVVAQTGSTNGDLIADSAAPDRSLLAAEDQVSGRGRLDRSWITAPRAGLTVSFLFRPRPPVSTWGWLPLLAGVALRAVLPETPTWLKWPNDVMTADGDLKLAGILAQTTGDAVVIGIGLNVSMTAAELPVDTATSLLLVGATNLDRTQLLIDLASSLDHRVAQWEDVNGDAQACGLAADYVAACGTLGRLVRVTTLDCAGVTGTATGIAADGRLVVDVDGEPRSIGAGDVEHLRGA